MFRRQAEFVRGGDANAIQAQAKFLQEGNIAGAAAADEKFASAAAVMAYRVGDSIDCECQQRRLDVFGALAAVEMLLQPGEVEFLAAAAFWWWQAQKFVPHQALEQRRQ